MKTRNAILLGCAIVLGACNDSTTEPHLGASGSLSFSYTGAGIQGSSTYSASGAIPASVGSSNNLGTSAWAAGGVSQAENTTFIGAAIPKTSTTWDVTSISIGRTTVGTSQVSTNCDLEDSGCTGVFVLFGNNPNGDTFSQFCSLTTGSVTISAISSTNITGTFSGTGTCFDPNFDETPFVVTNGAFNVGVTTQIL